MRQQQVSVRLACEPTPRRGVDVRLASQGLALAFVSLLIALLAASCSAGPGGTSDGGTGDVTTNPCGSSNYTMCGSTCVDTQGDYQNCGTCGNVCGSSDVCSHGTCAVVCGGGSSRCGSNCVDLKSDPSNCGGCSTACTSGQVCNNGMCALTCQQGLTNCNGGCVDVTSDDFNCGSCGNGCPNGEQCVNSACQATCQAGWSSCPTDGGTTCVDTSVDPSNCGSCNHPCTTGYFCSNGTCGLNCAGGTSLCSNECVDESIDPNNCGACNNACGTGKTCSGAHCCADATPYYCGGCNTFANCVAKSGGGIVAGEEHTCAINPSGAVYCWGYNVFGQLGNGGTTSKDTATAVGTPLTSGAATLAAAEYGTCAITVGGAAYCWGYNPYGQLGNSTYTTEYSPAAVTGISSTAAGVAGGGYYANCVLLKNGAVTCFGADYEGQICLGSVTSTTYDTPQTSVITSGATAIAGSSLGYINCAAVSGGLECWGYDQYSLGDGTTTNSGSPITVKNVTNPVAANSSYYHTCVVTTGGALKCWGENAYGELGDGTTTSSNTVVTATLTGVIAVATGYYHTCAVTTGGAVYCIGYNGYGQLGNGTTTSSTTWVEAIASGAVGIAAGDEHSCALMATGHAYCWGWNSEGQLGNGTMTNSSSPVLVSGF